MRKSSPHRSRRIGLWGLAALALAVSGSTASASEPEMHKVIIDSKPGTTVYKWKGEVPPGAYAYKGVAVGPCANNPDVEDIHKLVLGLANARVYKEANATFTFTIRWSPETGDDTTSDIEMEIYGPSDTPIGESTSSGPLETYKTTNLDEGTYKVVTCPASVAVPQPYEGELEVVVSPKSRKKPAAAPAAPIDSSGDGPGSANTVPTRTPATTPAFSRPAAVGAGRIPASVTASPLDSTEPSPIGAAPAAFLGGREAPETAGPPPVDRGPIAETTKIPLWLPLLLSVGGLAGGAFALVLRRKRGLDRPVSTRLTPMTPMTP